MMKKIQEEKIIFENELSFKSSFPSLRNYFFWHYHPELELVYIEAPHGIRNVGKHISNFTESDLILIGPNIPHLNFDYGIKTHYYQAVIQMKTSLVDVLMDTPECNKIKELLERSYLGLSFKGKTKKEVARRIKDFKSERKLDGLLDLIKIFQILAESNEFDVLNTDDMRVRLCFHDKIRMEIIYNYVHENYHNKLNVHEIAQAVNLTTSAFCRYFKKQTNLTFTNFANSYRISMAKIFLLQNISVSEVCYQVGFNSISYFSTLFKKLVGKTPMDFKSK